MPEEFEIRIGEEIREDPVLREPHLTRGKHRVWGDPERDDLRIVFGQAVYEKLNQHARSEPNREVGGVLLGDVCRHEGSTYVEVTEAIPARLTHAGAAHLTFTTDTWAAINGTKDERWPNLKIVGWYHSHPRMSVFLSGDDLFLHQNFFKQPWQVALVLEPHKHYGGFFIWKGGAVGPAAGFYETFDTSGKSIVSWRNLLPPESGSGSARERSQWVITWVAMALLAAVMAGLGVLSFQTQDTLNGVGAELSRVQGELVALKATESALGGRVEGMRRATDGTATAQAMEAMQAASIRATEQARVAATMTAAAVVATQTAGLPATATAAAANGTASAQAVQPQLTTTPTITVTVRTGTGTPTPSVPDATPSRNEEVTR